MPDMSMTRVVVLISHDGVVRRYPITADVALHETYEFAGKVWRVMCVYTPDTTNHPAPAVAHRSE